MADYKTVVEEQAGSAIYRTLPAKRTSKDFDVRKVSAITQAAFKKVCVTGDATPDDYKHVFYAALGSSVMDYILEAA